MKEWKEAARKLAKEHGEDPDLYELRTNQAVEDGKDPYQFLLQLTEQRNHILATSTLYRFEKVSFEYSLVFTFSDIILKCDSSGYLLLILVHKSLLEADHTRRTLGIPIHPHYRKNDIEITFARFPEDLDEIERQSYVEIFKQHFEQAGLLPERLIYCNSLQLLADNFGTIISTLFPSHEIRLQHLQQIGNISTAFLKSLQDYAKGFPHGNVYVRKEMPVFQFEREPHQKHWAEAARQLALEQGEDVYSYVLNTYKAIKSGEDPYEYLQRITAIRNHILKTSTLYRFEKLSFEEGNIFAFSDIIVKCDSNGFILLVLVHKTLFDADHTRQILGIPINNLYRKDEIEIIFKPLPMHLPRQEFLENFRQLKKYYEETLVIHPEQYFFHPDFEVQQKEFNDIMLRLFPTEELRLCHAKSLEKLEVAFHLSLMDYQDGFTDGNIYVRKNMQVFHKAPVIAEYPTELELELYHAASHADSKRVLELLRRGVNPNASVSIDLSILGGATVRAMHDASIDPAEILETIKHLIRYGANINNKELSSSGLNVEQQALRWSRISNGGPHAATYVEILRLIKASKTARPLIKVPAFHRKDPLGWTVDEGNFVLIKRAAIQPVKMTLEVQKQLLNFTMNYRAPDGRTIVVESKSIKQLTYTECWNMFEIFRIHFPITVDLTMKAIFAAFWSLLQLSYGEKVVDLIKFDGKVCGFNIATIYRSSLQGSSVIVHNVDLAITSHALSEFRRFMTLISHQRGYALQRSFPEIDVITTYNSMSIQSLLQANGTSYFPKFDELAPQVPALAKIVAPNAQVKRTAYATFQEGALEPYMDQKYQRKKHFESQTDLEHEFVSRFSRPGKFGFFVALQCHQQNFNNHCELIEPDLAQLFPPSVQALTDHYLVCRKLSECNGIPKSLPGLFAVKAIAGKKDEVAKPQGGYKSKL